MSSGWSAPTWPSGSADEAFQAYAMRKSDEESCILDRASPRWRRRHTGRTPRVMLPEGSGHDGDD